MARQSLRVVPTPRCPRDALTRLRGPSPCPCFRRRDSVRDLTRSAEDEATRTTDARGPESIASAEQEAVIVLRVWPEPRVLAIPQRGSSAQRAREPGGPLGSRTASFRPRPLPAAATACWQARTPSGFSSFRAVRRLPPSRGIRSPMRRSPVTKAILASESNPSGEEDSGASPSATLSNPNDLSAEDVQRGGDARAHAQCRLRPDDGHTMVHWPSRTTGGEASLARNAQAMGRGGRARPGRPMTMAPPMIGAARATKKATGQRGGGGEVNPTARPREGSRDAEPALMRSTSPQQCTRPGTDLLAQLREGRNSRDRCSRRTRSEA